MNLLMLAAHSIAEHDDIRMFTDLGVDIFSIGAYSDPHDPGTTLRAALPQAPQHPELMALCDIQREKHAGQSTDMGIVDWAKADLHPDILDWADVIVVHHFLDSWVIDQWDALKASGKRIIWRTCGQSDPRLEHEMRALHEQGLQIVRYSPAERRAFEPIGVFAGEDALIRFGKYPADYGPWTGEQAVVGNITQNLDIRGEHVGYGFWQQATKGLPTLLAGTGSERIGGLGELSYDEMRAYLCRIRAFLYMGTQPASYTLALMEAMLTGTPVVSIGPESMWMPLLFEGHQIAPMYADDPPVAGEYLSRLLRDPDHALHISRAGRVIATDLFGVETVGPQWAAFLGVPPVITFQGLEAVLA